MKKSPILKTLLCFFFSALIVAPTFAVSDDLLHIFGINGIYYYDPTGASNLCKSSGDCYISGNTVDERLWSALRHVGFTPEQSAAILGNIVNEGSTPTRQEEAYNIARDKGCKTEQGQTYDIHLDSTNGATHDSCMQQIYSKYSKGKSVAGIGLGFIQWTSHGRREGYLNVMRELGLSQYFEGDAYKTYGRYTDSQLKEAIIKNSGSENDYWLLWCAAIKYIYTEITQNFPEFFNYSSVTDLAGFTAQTYEVCASCLHTTDPGYIKRVADAESFYATYKAGGYDAIENGTTSSHISASASGANVTIIGDSISNGAKNALAAALPDANIVAQDGKHFTTDVENNPSGLSVVKDLLSKSQLQSTVVFALGTNDSLTSTEIDSVINTIGQNHNIIFVTNYDASDPSRYDENNKLLTAAATRFDNVSIIDWANIVKTETAANNKTYILDESATAGYAVHLTDDGKNLWTEQIVSAINGTAAPTACTVSGNITTADEALRFVQQFITDTNKLYNQNYPMINSLEINVLTNTPGSDNPVSPVASVRSSWISSGLITENDFTSACWGATYCGQCTAFSGWFATMMTKYFYNSGDGVNVVSKMSMINPTLPVTNQPTTFSIFSEKSTSGNPAGHTGVVVGDFGDGTYLTIENNQGNHSIKVKQRSFDSSASFIIVADGLKLEHLGTTYD